MESELIQDQLIANAPLSAVRDKLLEEDLTLDKALAIACQVEAAVKNATLLSSSATMVPAAPVQAVEATHARFWGKGGAQPAQTHEHPCTLSAAERKYSTVEKEALACVWAVERWRIYVWGRRFILRTNHQALTT